MSQTARTAGRCLSECGGGCSANSNNSFGAICPVRAFHFPNASCTIFMVTTRFERALCAFVHSTMIPNGCERRMHGPHCAHSAATMAVMLMNVHLCNVHWLWHRKIVTFLFARAHMHTRNRKRKCRRNRKRESIDERHDAYGHRNNSNVFHFVLILHSATSHRIVSITMDTSWLFGWCAAANWVSVERSGLRMELVRVQSKRTRPIAAQVLLGTYISIAIASPQRALSSLQSLLSVRSTSRHSLCAIWARYSGNVIASR